MTNPAIHVGKIAGGDKFVSCSSNFKELITDVPDVIAVEMEKASVAQVCHDHNIPFVIIRTISDKANHSAEIDFNKFIDDIAKHYSINIIEHLFTL